jgi:membrane protease subunit HflC
MRHVLSALLVLVGLAAAAVYFSYFIVHQNQQALVLRFGDPRRILTEPGLNWKLPWVETVEFLDRRLLDIDTNPQTVLVAGNKQLVVDSFARYRITDALKFAQRLQDERNARNRLGVILDSSLRAVLGNATIQDVVRDKRAQLMDEIQRRVNDQAKDLGVEVVDVRIMRADLPAGISEAVYQRMKAERQQEAFQFRAEGEQQKRTIQADADRQVTIIKAEAQRTADQLRGDGEGERNRIFAEAFGKDPDFFAFYRSMQAYEQGLKSKDTRLLLSPDSEFFRYFNNPGASPPGQGSSSTRR